MSFYSYKRPGVYIDEAPFQGFTDVGMSTSVALFVGMAVQGPTEDPALVTSWQEYVALFGGFTQPKSTAAQPNADFTYLPYAVYSFFQNGGRNAYVRRAVSPSGGFTHATVDLYGTLIEVEDGGEELPDFTAAEPGDHFTDAMFLTVPNQTALLTMLNGDTIAYAPAPLYSDEWFNGRTVKVDIQPVSPPAVTTTEVHWNGTAWAADAPTLVDHTNIEPNDVIDLADFTSVIGTPPADLSDFVALSTYLLAEGFDPSTLHQAAWTPTTFWTITDEGGTPASIALIWDGVTWQETLDPGTTGFSPGVQTTNGVRPRATATAESSLISFSVRSKSAGTWANSNVAVVIMPQTYLPDPTNPSDFAAQVYTLGVLVNNGTATTPVWSQVETFQNLCNQQIPGTQRPDVVVNSSSSGSQFITVLDVNIDSMPYFPIAANGQPDPVVLTGGTDGPPPLSADLVGITSDSVGKIDNPLMVNIAGYDTDALSGGREYVAAFWSPSTSQRTDVISINDYARKRNLDETSADYASLLRGTNNAGGLLTDDTGNSRVAAYTPWITIPDPAVNGGTITIPPAGLVSGLISRNDSTRGVYQTPAGVTAVLSNALNVDCRFTDNELGDLNVSNINAIRPVAGSGICIMGGRTRKTYGVDKYLAPRRTLIFIEESLRRSTEFAVFENNDAVLWARLRNVAERILRPIWSDGGLKGASATEAFRIICDASNNTPDVIAAGEVRMDVGVALQYPAEFVIIRLSQYDGGASSVTATT